MSASPASIAVVGMACIFPDARSPGELWELALAQRRAFRRLPPERLRLEDYYSSDRNAADRTYVNEVGVIDGYEFDRMAFRVAGSTFRSADMAHWLALDVAARALADAGFADGNGLPRETTGVLIGNTLAGEFSRANSLRLRWPYVRRVVENLLAREQWTPDRRAQFLAELEGNYKSPFPPVTEESLAGGLSNTIAGRICNHFDLKGGGYTVDGACSGSLLAIANACSSLAAGDLDVALAGGVDLSLDPFELVGFAKAGALAAEEMFVFDKRSNGFWPGEGCGAVVLMRHDDALAQGHRVYAVVRGWGISSDGGGGITRPEVDGQIEALRRAYRRAGFGFDSVSYCEAHGTGTTVGDATELEVLSRARGDSPRTVPPVAVGSIKANIGHTKSAAGIAGFIKATMAVHTQVLPPTTGCEQPHSQLTGPSPALRVLRAAEPWPDDRPLRAGVSAMGFGGINVHVVLESIVAERRAGLSVRERALVRSRQDAELFLISAESPEALASQVKQLLSVATGISRAEMIDLAAELQRTLRAESVRAAIIAARPAALAEKLATLENWIREGATTRLDFAGGIFLGSGRSAQIAFLFPGQGSPASIDGGDWRRRFDSVDALYSRAELPADGDAVSTRVAQPAVVTASLAGLQLLEQCGIGAVAAVGHSLGELTALHWAGAFSSDTLLRIARVRGVAMSELGNPTGVMLALAAPWQKVKDLLNGEPISIVGYNSPRQTTVAGEAAAVHKLARLAAGRGTQSSLLPVSHAFHTPLVAAAAPVLAKQLEREDISPPNRAVFSTVTGALLDADEDLRRLLCRQVTSPVRFADALSRLLNSHAVDLLVEVGPGSVLSGLARDAASIPVVSLDAGGKSLNGLLQVVGSAFALGAPVKTATLFDDRFTRPFSLDRKPKFFANPCESVPVGELVETIVSATHESNGTPPPTIGSTTESPIDLLRRLVAESTELPVAAVGNDSRMLSDLHLNSLAVGQLISKAARQLGLPPIVGLTEFANASLSEIVNALEGMMRHGGAARATSRGELPAGVDSWVRPFHVDWVEAPHPRLELAQENLSRGGWRIFAPKEHSLAASLRKALARTHTVGTAICLPENPGPDEIPILLEAARSVLETKGSARFLIVQHGWGGSGFAKTLHLERPDTIVCIVNVPKACPSAAQWAAKEAAAATGFCEVRFNRNGRRFEPRWKLIEDEPTRMKPAFPVGPTDVLLVTGGGKGIAAECALALARETGVRLGLIGRSDPESDTELKNNLDRFAAAGVRLHYACADVTLLSEVRTAVAKIESALGPVTAVLHGAGINRPQLIGALDQAAFRQTTDPKISGLKNVLAAVASDRLKLLVTFSSIIARTGLPGEADYAAANEWLTAATGSFQNAHPACRCLALEWSIWSGTGMGERLGRIESLIQQGITPISVDEGVRIFCDLLGQPADGATSLVVTGRFGELPTVQMSERDLPLRRFLERPRVYFPGVELVVETELSPQTDPYLEDHVLQKQKLLPAVLGLEAMAQTAMALAASSERPVLENVEFLRPVTALENERLRIRLAALRRPNGRVEVCLRCEETDFQVDHFRAVCLFGAREGVADASASITQLGTDGVELNAQTDLYGKLLFHRGRFCRVRGYRLLKARECVAEITADDRAVWFGPYLPQEFVLGNPAARDAALHAIQACVPHRRILPVGIERLQIGRHETGIRFVRATERFRTGDDFVYDVRILDARGELVERWDGLRLRAVARVAMVEAWPDALLAPYLERSVEELASDASARIAFERGLREDGSAATDAVIQQALGKPARIWRRADGRPVLAGVETVSAAHAGDYTLAIGGGGSTSCDVQEVRGRTDGEWRDLLGRDRYGLAERTARECHENLDTAATRIWMALECLKKAGKPVKSPLVFESNRDDGWAVLRSGRAAIVTCVAAVRGIRPALGVAVMVRLRTERPVADTVLNALRPAN